MSKKPCKWDKCSHDLEPYIQMNPGDVVEEDVTCNSAFMLEKMPLLGQRIRQVYHWVPPDQTIYLQLDNAGGHGTNGAIAQYTSILHDQYNISVIHQPPRSPDTNALDLGLWRSLQAHVERANRDRIISTDSLAQSTRDGWDMIPSQTIKNVFNKLPDIWEKIIASGGQDVA
jgi:hypothetical protein